MLDFFVTNNLSRVENKQNCPILSSHQIIPICAQNGQVLLALCNPIFEGHSSEILENSRGDASTIEDENPAVSSKFQRESLCCVFSLQEGLRKALEPHSQLCPLNFTWKRSVQLNFTFAGKSFNTAGFGYILPGKNPPTERQGSQTSTSSPATAMAPFSWAVLRRIRCRCRGRADPWGSGEVVRSLGMWTVHHEVTLWKMMSPVVHCWRSSPTMGKNMEQLVLESQVWDGLGFGGEWWVFMA